MATTVRKDKDSDPSFCLRLDRGTHEPLSCSRRDSLPKSWTRQRLLFHAPVLLAVAVASLDSADRQLLACSIASMGDAQRHSISKIGRFSLLTNLSYALSLPVWGWLVRENGVEGTRIMLTTACVGWGLSVVYISWDGTNLVSQSFFRSMNCAVLGSTLPLGQTLLVDVIEPSSQNQAFRFIDVCEKIAATVSAASVLYMDRWQDPYYIVGAISVLAAFVTRSQIQPVMRAKRSCRSPNLSGPSQKDERQSVYQIICKVSSSFPLLCLVIQGMFNSTASDMMSFLLLLMDWRGFKREQILVLHLSSGVSMMVGGWIGGTLGDFAHARSPAYGRIAVALASTLGTIPSYGMYLSSSRFEDALFWKSAFHLWTSWARLAALRPICAQLITNPLERAQIVALWAVLERASGAIFGAPLAGYLTSYMLKNKAKENELLPSNKADALALVIFGLSVLCWFASGIIWAVMALTIARRESLLNFVNTKTPNARSPATIGDDEDEDLLAIVKALSTD